MKILFTILAIIGGLVALFLILALFIKKEYSLQREITINRPRNEVFDFIRHLKNQDRYSVWIMMDPNLEKSFRGTDGTVGFVYAWEGNDKAGKGEQEIVSLQDGSRMEVEIRFEKPFKSVAYAPFTLEATSEKSTKVTWGMRGRSAYPMNVMNLFMDNLLGRDLQTSLDNLKKLMENS